MRHTLKRPPKSQNAIPVVGITGTGECPRALEKVKQAALNNENIFAELVEAVKVCSLGQIADLLYQVGGRYRRNV